MASGSSFDAYNFLDDDEWTSSITEQNQRVDCIIKYVIIHAAELSLQLTNHHVRALRRYIERIREKGHESVFEQYFAEDPIYPSEIFRTRYHMRKSLFERIMSRLVTTDEFFQQRADATGRLGMSAIQKCTAAMRVLAYGSSTDFYDEYLRMSAQLIRKLVIKFVEGVISKFGDEYLRKPTEEDIATLLHIGEQRGFPGRSGSPTIILEAVALQDLWIWHAFFGTPSSKNDINVLDQSPLFGDILEAFVKSIPAPQIRKHQLFAQHQEAARKDVERAFGVLQARFAFIKRPYLIWDHDIIVKIMIACIIIHNMIVDDEMSTYLNYHDPTEFIEDRVRQNNQRSEDQEEENDLIYSTEMIASLSSYMKTRSQLRNREAQAILRDDLIEHI